MHEELADAFLAARLILLISHNLHFERRDPFLGDAECFDSRNLAHHINERQTMHHTAIRGNDEVGRAPIDSLQQRKHSAAGATAICQHTNVSSTITDEWHLRCIEVGYDNLPGMTERLREPLRIDNLDEARDQMRAVASELVGQFDQRPAARALFDQLMAELVEVDAGNAAAVYLGALGTLALGPVADRVGLRRTLVVTQALIPPLVLGFVYAGGVLGDIAVMLVGVCIVGTFGVTMVLSQLYLPRHIGMA